MNHIQRLTTLLTLLAACGSPRLADSFRVDAEIISVEPADPTASRNCTPTMADIDPAGPDWQLLFERMHDAEEPTFREWSTSRNGDSAERCQDNGLGGGNEDCCTPLMAMDGGGWRLTCLGSDVDPSFRNQFDFTFGTNGSGTAISTRTNLLVDRVICATASEWTTVIPVAP